MIQLSLPFICCSRNGDSSRFELLFPTGGRKHARYIGSSTPVRDVLHGDNDRGVMRILHDLLGAAIPPSEPNGRSGS